MTELTVTGYEVTSQGRIRVGKKAADGTTQTTTFPPEAVTYRAAEYGLTSVRDALDLILHEPYQPTDGSDPRDDPALCAGWVTTTDPDSEPIWLYNARSTADAREAHTVRCTQNGTTVVDPDGYLDEIAAGLVIDPEKRLRHCEAVDTIRWSRVYGGLPIEGDADA